MPTSARSASMSEYRAKSFREITGTAIRPTVSPKDSTLIIIDAQNEYAEGLLQITNITQTRSAISSLLQAYREAAETGTESDPPSSSSPSRPSSIIHILHSVPDGAPVFTPNTSLADEFTELAPLPSEPVLSKKLPSAFKDTELHQHLQSAGGERGNRIVLVGYMAHVCVSTTARQAHELGYDVFVAGDAVGDRDIPGAKGEEVTRMVLLELADAFAEVVHSRNIR